MSQRMTARVAELTAARVPFVHATVVRSQEPSSARAGDDAVITGDGRIEGFVGGQCAEESVRAAALDALASGDPLLLRVLPDGGEHFPDSPSARVVVNPCLSGGALEIFLEPTLPAPLLAVVGSTPITDALVMMAGPLGFVARQHEPGHLPAGPTAVVVGTHGHGEAETLRAALDAGVGFVGLIASPKRGREVLASIELTEQERARVRTPVGLDIGARTPEEIALSILAELVQAVRREGLVAPAGAPTDVPQQVVDPVCGMTVVVGPDTPHWQDADGEHWFCATGCRDAWAADHPALAGAGS